MAQQIDPVELERRKDVCRGCPDFNWMPAFCNRECRLGDGAYCQRFAVDQYSKRLSGDNGLACDRWLAANGRVVVLPHLGEFGWLLMTHVRYFNWLRSAHKIAVCRPGHECLFPTAAGHVTDWENPIPDAVRCRDGKYQDGDAKEQILSSMRPWLRERFPDHLILAPVYDCKWHMSDGHGFKFRPSVPAVLPSVDVAIGPRRREFEEIRNWPHWPMFASSLHAFGLTVGVVGAAATSAPCAADVRAWDHPRGDTEGSIDLLLRCRLYVGVDSGTSHLAALCDTPTVILPTRSPHSEFGPMQRANKGGYHRLPDEAWDDPGVVAAEVARQLASRPRGATA